MKIKIECLFSEKKISDKGGLNFGRYLLSHIKVVNKIFARNLIASFNKSNYFWDIFIKIIQHGQGYNTWRSAFGKSFAAVANVSLTNL